MLSTDPFLTNAFSLLSNECLSLLSNGLAFSNEPPMLSNNHYYSNGNSLLRNGSLLSIGSSLLSFDFILAINFFFSNALL